MAIIYLSRERLGADANGASACSLPRASASDLLAARSEIAAGRIALFSQPNPLGRLEWFLLLSWHATPIWTVNAHRLALPRLSPGTLALCSSDFPLAPQEAPPATA